MDKNEQIMNDILTSLQRRHPTLEQPQQMADDIMNRIKHHERTPVWLLVARIGSLAASVLLAIGYATVQPSSAEGPVQNEESLCYYQQRVPAEMGGLSLAADNRSIQKRLFTKNTYEQLKKMAYENK